MEPAPAFTLGLITGLGLFAAFNLWRTARPLSATPLPPAPPAHTTTTSSAASTSTEPASNSDILQDTLESALREIREAGMVVIPQEFARYMMPAMVFSKNPSGEVRELLQLDDREITAMQEARTRFEQGLNRIANDHLQIVSSKDGIITATIPAFPEQHKKLMENWHSEVMKSLDTSSAEMFPT
jgi:hypothetical protein